MNLNRVPFCGVKLMAQEPDDSFPSTVKFKNACGCTFVPPNVDIARVLEEHRSKFVFFIYFLINGSSCK
jgi:hypothetical protein